MPNILTPKSIWKSLDDSLDVSPEVIDEHVNEGIKFRNVYFYGRDTGSERVKIFGCYACDEKNPSQEVVLIIPDSEKTVDEEILKLYVKKGYSAFMVDIRGEHENTEHYTKYPDEVNYANTRKVERHKDFVDDSADKTCWFEWVAVGVYARKYLIQCEGVSEVAVAGIRDGGEVVWKLITAAEFSCAITVCAVGWLAYKGRDKYGVNEVNLDEERQRFLGGIDSQSYAPYVKCPVLILCSTNDDRFNYDRAYDTYTRINPKHIENSVVAYSITCNSCIGAWSTADMFMFLDKHLKKRQVFIPKPVEITVSVDDEDNLIATASFDDRGRVEKFNMFFAEDCANSSMRDWSAVEYKREISENEHEFFLNIYEKTSSLYLLCMACYSNGFTSWSKVVVKKISGKFRNMRPKCKIMYSVEDGVSGFVIADHTEFAVGGMFLTSSVILPQLVTKTKKLQGLYSICGLSTFRMNNPRYSPASGSVLKIDLFADRNATITLTLSDVASDAEYSAQVKMLGGVWQCFVLDSKSFKSKTGVPLNEFTHNFKFVITCDERYAVNNVMWL